MKFIEIFSRYLERGGEELGIERMGELLSTKYPLEKCWFKNSDWKGADAPPVWKQALLIGNNKAARKFVSETSKHFDASCWIFHNLVPVASLGMYYEARDQQIPVIQYVHNFKPFSPGGTLWVNNRINPAALERNMLPEVLGGAWQNSVLKTAILAFHLSKFFKSGAIDSVSAWATNSDFMRQKFIAAGIPEKKVHTLRYHWNPKPVSENCRDQGYYLFLGRLVSEKGIEVLLEAWDLLSKEMGGAAPYLIIAGTGPMAENVKEAAEKNAKISYVGFVSGNDKQSLIEGCRAMLAPSIWWEPLGLVTYEAYEAHKPMLAAASGGLTETIQHGVTGFLHEPGNSESLMESVLQCEQLSDTECIQMGEIGRQWLLKEAHPDKWIADFEKVARFAGA